MRAFYLAATTRQVMGPYCYAGLSRVADAVSHKSSWVDALTDRCDFPPSLQRELEAVGESLEGEKKERCKILIFLRHCWCFHKHATKPLGQKDASDLAKAMNMPEYACARLLELFAVPRPGGGHAVTKQLKDKRCAYMLVLYVLAAGGEDVKVSDVAPFAADMKLEAGKAGEMLRQAGFIVKKGKGGGRQTVGTELKVPLVFPNIKRGRG